MLAASASPLRLLHLSSCNEELPRKHTSDTVRVALAALACPRSELRAAPANLTAGDPRPPGAAQGLGELGRGRDSQASHRPAVASPHKGAAKAPSPDGKVERERGLVYPGGREHVATPQGEKGQHRVTGGQRAAQCPWSCGPSVSPSPLLPDPGSGPQAGRLWRC